MIDLSHWQLGDCIDLTCDAMILPDAELLALTDQCEAVLIESLPDLGVDQLKTMNRSVRSMRDELERRKGGGNWGRIERAMDADA